MPRQVSTISIRIKPTRLKRDNRERLKELKKSFNVRSYNAVLGFLLKNQGQEYSEASSENIANDSVHIF